MKLQPVEFAPHKLIVGLSKSVLYGVIKGESRSATRVNKAFLNRPKYLLKIPSRAKILLIFSSFTGLKLSTPSLRIQRVFLAMFNCWVKLILQLNVHGLPTSLTSVSSQGWNHHAIWYVWNGFYCMFEQEFMCMWQWRMIMFLIRLWKWHGVKWFAQLLINLL